MAICITVCAPHADVHSRMRALWRFAFPYVRRMPMHVHSRMRAPWRNAFPYARPMAKCIPVCAPHAIYANVECQVPRARPGEGWGDGPFAGSAIPSVDPFSIESVAALEVRPHGDMRSRMRAA